MTQRQNTMRDLNAHLDELDEMEAASRIEDMQTAAILQIESLITTLDDLSGLTGDYDLMIDIDRLQKLHDELETARDEERN